MKLVDGGKAHGAQRQRTEDAEPELHLVQPGSACWGAGPPSVFLWLVRVEIVEDYMEFPVAVDLHDLVHEVHKFASAPALELAGLNHSLPAGQKGR